MSSAPLILQAEMNGQSWNMQLNKTIKNEETWRQLQLFQSEKFHTFEKNQYIFCRHLTGMNFSFRSNFAKVSIPVLFIIRWHILVQMFYYRHLITTSISCKDMRL